MVFGWQRVNSYIHYMATINETWLVLIGGSLFGAFPLAYATILNALYIPIFLMIFGFIFRGVAFEFREQASNKFIWNISFAYDFARERLFSKPMVYLFAVIPVLGVVLIWQLIRSLNNKAEKTPFIWTILLFVLTFFGLGLVVFPYIIPTEITIYEAAADPSSLVFMLIFIGALIPVMLFYNVYQYFVFRGKVTNAHYGE